VDFSTVAASYTCIKLHANTRCFVSHFGLNATQCKSLWQLLLHKQLLPAKAHPKHLLWTLNFLKEYRLQDTAIIFCKVSNKTYMLWVKAVLKSISLLGNVSEKCTFPSNQPLDPISNRDFFN